MKYKCILLVVSMVLVVVSTNVFAVNERYVDGKNWSVTDFDENYNPKAYHPVPWVFHRNGTVEAGNLWKGTWTDLGEDKIRMKIGNDDPFIVIFLSDKWFIAIKGGDLYRLGRQVGY